MMARFYLKTCRYGTADTDYLIYLENFLDGQPEFFITHNELLSRNYFHPFRALFKQ
jgi:hypothetical protein